MPVKPGEASLLFQRLLLLYFSPALLYYLVRVVTSWRIFPVLSDTSSSAAACIISFLYLLLLVIPEYLQFDMKKQPPEFLFVAVPELHCLVCHFFAIVYGPPNWLLYPISILTYPLTHLFMYNQFTTLGLTPAELGHFAAVSTRMRDNLFGAIRVPRRYDSRSSDGRS
ncbi:hypothetical protein CVT26_000767 [Gymnopilus dilepis]|uniref:Uncharacterized protein n=1 Tax=Gymnopilus dilepis TaxID=231916 RepID=A0A409Y2R4_9AGAR|nr:hypothetical protein CVT26_000767 [Gymnopilus dilepis]